jgi:hypothetical protein
VGDHVLLVVDALSGGDCVHPQFVQIDRVVFPDPESAGSTVAAGDDEVDTLFLFELCQSALHAEHPGRADDFTDVEDSQGCTKAFPGTQGAGCSIVPFQHALPDPRAKDTKESVVVEGHMELDKGGRDLLFSPYQPGW